MKTTYRMMALWLTLWSLAPAGGSGEQEALSGSAPAVADRMPIFIEVEVRFIEIGQNDIDQSDAWMIVESNTVSKRGKMAQTESHAPPVHVSPGGGGSNALSITSVLTDPQLEHVLHALEQRDGANLLSAPKVTTKSGANAEIKVVREVRYPVEFEAQVAVLDKASGKISLLSSNESTSASNQVMSAVGIPKFETREAGVILNVTPVLDSDGKTIHLTLHPEVTELVEWIDYGSTMKYADGSSQQMKMLQPVFHNRSLNSQISVQDGQTVIMGGLITETRATTEDKIPYLGKIPLLGKLFRSKTTKNIKRNLLIFVTARQVNSTGKPSGSPKGD